MAIGSGIEAVTDILVQMTANKTLQGKSCYIIWQGRCRNGAVHIPLTDFITGSPFAFEIESIN